MPAIEKIAEKCFSGRFIATVAITLTYCFIVIWVSMAYCRALATDPGKLEAFAVGLCMGFVGTAGVVIKSYFDKKPEENNSSTTETKIV